MQTHTHTLFHATRHQSHRPSDRDNLLCLHHAFNAQTRVKHEFFITRARPADGKASQSPHDDGENRKEQRAQRIRPRATAGMVPTAHIWYASRAGSECLRRLLPVICVIISASAQPPFRSRHTHTHAHTHIHTPRRGSVRIDFSQSRLASVVSECCVPSIIPAATAVQWCVSSAS